MVTIPVTMTVAMVAALVMVTTLVPAVMVTAVMVTNLAAVMAATVTIPVMVAAVTVLVAAGDTDANSAGADSAGTTRCRRCAAAVTSRGGGGVEWGWRGRDHMGKNAPPSPHSDQWETSNPTPSVRPPPTPIASNGDPRTPPRTPAP